MFEKKGLARIEKTVERIKTDITDLNKGMGEVDQVIDANNQRVDIAKEELAILETEVKNSNTTLEAAKNMASSLKGNLESVLGIAQ
jgi:chromosome segregation ATPase